MRGGQVFMETLVAHGVTAIFGNPGTTENSLLDRLADHPALTYYTALHEGVAVSAASFHAQASGSVTAANVHVAPGLGNAIGALYGALKACSPLVVTAGAQDTRMRLRDPLLGHDLVAMAAPVTKWSAQPASADELGPMLARAIRIATTPPRGPVFMALPVDVMEQDTEHGPAAPPATPVATAAEPRAIEDLANRILASRSPCIVVGDDVARSGFDAMGQLATLTGARVLHDGLRAQLCFPNRHPCFQGRVPFEAGAMLSLFAGADLVLLVGGPAFEEVWHDPVDPFPKDALVAELEESAQRIGRRATPAVALAGDLARTLQALVEAIERQADAAWRAAAAARIGELERVAAERHRANEGRLEKTRSAQPITPAWALVEIAAHTPHDAVVVDESITASLEVANAFDFRRPGDYFAGRGGGIGQGIAGALGVQVAMPDRPVLALSGDGSAMYSIQALWTAAHHRLPIVFVVLANREYRVLKHNLDIYRQRFEVPSNKPYPHMDLDGPTLDFAAMARGMGVAAETVTRLDELGAAVERAFAARAPRLIEVVVAGKET